MQGNYHSRSAIQGTGFRSRPGDCLSSHYIKYYSSERGSGAEDKGSDQNLEEKPSELAVTTVHALGNWRCHTDLKNNFVWNQHTRDNSKFHYWAYFKWHFVSLFISSLNNTLNLKYRRSVVRSLHCVLNHAGFLAFENACVTSYLIYHMTIKPARSLCLYNTELFKILLISFRIQNSYRKHEISEYPGRTLYVCKDSAMVEETLNVKEKLRFHSCDCTNDGSVLILSQKTMQLLLRGCNKILT